MQRIWTAAAACLVLGPFASGAHAHGGDTIAQSALEWRDIVPGVAFAAAYGDWDKEAHGKYVRIAKGAKVPMHFHSNDYRAVVISGRMVNLYEGDQKTEVATGDYFYMAARRPHSHECLSDEGCTFYTYGDGKWDIEVSGAK